MGHAATISPPKLQHQMLSQYIFGPLKPGQHLFGFVLPNDEASTALNAIARVCLNDIYQTVYSGRADLAKREWDANPSGSDFRVLQLAFQSLGKQAALPTVKQRWNLTEYYRSMRNEKLKQGRIYLYYAIAIPIDDFIDTKPALIPTESGDDVETAFNAWIQRHKGPSQVDALSLYISIIPPEIGRLQSLTVLHLGNKELRTLPPEIGQLQSLKILEINETRLTTLPPEIGQLQSLKYCDLSKNQISTLPPEVGKLSSLIILDLRENNISTLPSDIRQIPRLEELAISKNPLNMSLEDLQHLLPNTLLT